jgi:hypothetical protein
MQPARYHALRDRTLAAVDRTFAEPVMIVARQDKGGDRDEARFSGEIEAVLRVNDGKETPVSGGRDRDWRTRISAQRASLHINRAKYPDIVSRPGDEVQALSRPGEPWFEVLAVDARGLSRLVLHLGETA